MYLPRSQICHSCSYIYHFTTIPWICVIFPTSLSVISSNADGWSQRGISHQPHLILVNPKIGRVPSFSVKGKGKLVIRLQQKKIRERIIQGKTHRACWIHSQTISIYKQLFEEKGTISLDSTKPSQKSWNLIVKAPSPPPAMGAKPNQTHFCVLHLWYQALRCHCQRWKVDWGEQSSKLWQLEAPSLVSEPEWWPSTLRTRQATQSPFWSLHWAFLSNALSCAFPKPKNPTFISCHSSRRCLSEFLQKREKLWLQLPSRCEAQHWEPANPDSRNVTLWKQIKPRLMWMDTRKSRTLCSSSQAAVEKIFPNSSFWPSLNCYLKRSLPVINNRGIFSSSLMWEYGHKFWNKGKGEGWCLVWFCTLGGLFQRCFLFHSIWFQKFSCTLSMDRSFSWGNGWI